MLDELRYGLGVIGADDDGGDAGIFYTLTEGGKMVEYSNTEVTYSRIPAQASQQGAQQATQI